MIDTLLESSVMHTPDKITTSLEQFLAHDTGNRPGGRNIFHAFRSAARNNNRQIVSYWLDKYPRDQKPSADPEIVVQTSEDGFIDILPSLINEIRQRTCFFETLSRCLQVSSRNGHLQVIEYLISERANINHGSDGETALQAALLGFKRFGRFGPEWWHSQEPDPYTADAPSQEQCIHMVLAKGADQNKMAACKEHSMNIAAAYYSIGVVQSLIDSGAHVDTVLEKYGTVLSAAASREMQSLPIIEAILEAGKTAKKDRLGEKTALHRALSHFGTHRG